MDSNEFGEGKAKEENIKKPAIILKFKTSRYIKEFACSVCPSSYSQKSSLTYHIRRMHFNLVAKINQRGKKKINEVWLEKVLNSDAVVEITKTGPNKYLMKKSSTTDADKIEESEDSIDLTVLYPDCTKKFKKPLLKRIWCSICKQEFLKSVFIKHMEDHDELLL